MKLLSLVLALTMVLSSTLAFAEPDGRVPIVRRPIPVRPAPVTPRPIVAYPRFDLVKKIQKPVVLKPVGRRLAPVAADKFGPNTRVTVGLYDANGNVDGSKVMSGKEIWDGLNVFTNNEIRKVNVARGRLSTDSRNKLATKRIATKVVQKRVFDRGLNQEIEVVELPQDLEVSKNFVSQEKRLVLIPIIPIRPPVIIQPPAGPDHDPNPYSTNTVYEKSWGKKSRFQAYLKGEAKVYGSRSKRRSNAYFRAGGYVFNKNVNLIKFQHKLEEGNSASSHTSLYVVGISKWESSSSNMSRNLRYTKELSKRQRFWVGPLPVSVGGAIGGSLGGNLTTSRSANVLSGSVKPYIDSYGEADAAIDVWLARAGIEGRLRIIRDDLPAIANLTFNPIELSLSSKFKVRNELRALDGKVSVYAKIRKFWGGWKKWSKTIFSWNGFVKNWTLADRTRTSFI